MTRFRFRFTSRLAALAVPSVGALAVLSRPGSLAFLAVFAAGCSSPAGEASAATTTDAGATDAGDAGATPAFPTTDLTADPACTAAGCLRALAVFPAASASAALLAAFAPAGTPLDNGFKTYTIRYMSASSDEVSGTVFVPDVAAPAEGFPAVVLSQPTSGIGPKCAPSLGVLSTVLAATTAARGFVVLMPDAPSFGAPPYATYMLKDTAAKATLDGARVLLRLGTALLTKIQRKVAFAGHSQGAHSTLSAAEYLTSYAPELPAVGFAANGPPAYFLEGATYALSRTDSFDYFLAMRMWSWQRTLSPVQPAIFVGTFAQNAETTFLECQNEGVSPGDGKLPDMVPADPNGVVNPVYIQMAQGGATGWAEPWKTWHTENVPSPKAVPVPVAVWQGTADASVLASATRAYVAKLRAGGLTVELNEVAGAKHNDSAIGPLTLPQAGGESYIAWLRARFAN